MLHTAHHLPLMAHGHRASPVAWHYQAVPPCHQEGQAGLGQIAPSEMMLLIDGVRVVALVVGTVQELAAFLLGPGAR